MIQYKKKSDYLIGLGRIFISVRATAEAQRWASVEMFLRLPQPSSLELDAEIGKLAEVKAKAFNINAQTGTDISYHIWPYTIFIF